MGQQDCPIVEREFKTDDKGRMMVVCVLCGEIRAYKTKGEGRCCMRTTHKWRPIAKTNRDDEAAQMPDEHPITEPTVPERLMIGQAIHEAAKRCPSCGSTNTTTNADFWFVRCRDCGKTWDQDKNFITVDYSVLYPQKNPSINVRR